MIPFPSIKTVLTLPSLALLVACGGGSSLVSFSELLERSNAYDAAPVAAADVTDGDALPSGTATFSGVTAVALQAATTGGDPDLALGALEVNVDFDTGQIRGTGNSFHQLDELVVDDLGSLSGTPINGNLSITLSQTGADQNQFTGSTSGSITTTDGRTETLSANAAGGFRGAQADGFEFEAGEAGGTVAISGFALKN